MAPHIQKVLEASIADGKLREDAIDEYWQRSMPIDASRSARLHDTLVAVMGSSKELNVVFLQALARLAPCLINNDQLRFWFTVLAPIAIDSGGKSNDIVSFSRQFISAVLEGNHDEDLKSIYHDNSVLYMRLLIDIYVGNPGNLLSLNLVGPESEERARYIRANIRGLLLGHSLRDLDPLLNVMYEELVKPKHRLLMLQLLSELVSSQLNGKLFRIANTPVLDFLMKCIERDDCSISVEIASTTLAMVLPHVSDKLVELLPRLLACYGRMSSWLPSMTDSVLISPGADDGTEKESPTEKSDWDTLNAAFRSREPNAAPLFNILYALFPNNTLKFCRHADDYLSQANFSLSFNSPWDRFLILEKSQELFPQFTLHPLLLTSNAEQEIASATSRFQKLASAAGITFMCIEMQAVGSGDDALMKPNETPNGDLEPVCESLLNQHQQLFMSSLDQSSTGLFNGGRVTKGGPNSESSTRPNTPKMRATSPAPSPPNPGAGHAPKLTALIPSNPASPIIPQADSPVVQTTIALAEGSSDSNGRGRNANRDRSSSNTSARLRQSMSPAPRSAVAQGSPLAQLQTQSLQNTPTLTPIDERKNYSSSVDYYVRELLLNKNELDFANFTRHIVERKVVRLQKQLRELGMAKIRIEYLSGENKKLNARLSKIEEEHSQTQRVARTRLRDRTAYETSLLEKNRELRVQFNNMTAEIEQKQVQIEKLQEDHAQITEEFHQLASQIENEDSQAEVALRKNSTEQQVITEDHEPMANSYEVSEYEAKYHETLLELESVRAQLEQETAPLRKQVESLNAELVESKSKLEDRVRKLQLTTKTIAAEVQASEGAKFAQLQAAHNEQSMKIAQLERELMARRIHEEEQLSELRTTLLLSRPFSLQEAEAGEMRIRGRGGAQGTVRR